MENYEVDFFANLFKKDKAVIEAVKTKEDFDKLTTEYYDSLKDVKIFNPTEYETLVKNIKSEHITELVNSNDLPKTIYDKAAANAMAVKEKELAKKNGITEWKSMIDLIEQIIAKNSGNTEKDQLIAELRQEIKDTDKTHLEEVNKLKAESETFIVNDYLDREVARIPVDATDENQIAEVQGNLKAIFLSKFSVSRKDGKIIVSDKQGNILTDRVKEPRPLSEVLAEATPSYIKLKSLEGGRGDESTKNQGDGVVQTTEDYYKFRDKRGIKANSYEDAQLLAEVRAKNPTFQLA
jgi:hypothetical protein